MGNVVEDASMANLLLALAVTFFLEDKDYQFDLQEN
jgi:hypothetical protein